jgi:two-component system, sensor histidine kinase PdtaS
MIFPEIRRYRDGYGVPLRMLKRAFLFAVSLAFLFCGEAQEFEASFANSKTPGELMREIQVPKNDSNKISALLSLCEYHFTYSRDLDSAIGYAQKARMISTMIGYQSGADDAIFYLCKLYAHENQFRAVTILLDQVRPEQRVRLLITVGEHFLYNREQSKGDPDSAAAYFVRARDLAATLPADNWKQQCRIELAKYYFSTGELKKGKETFQSVIDLFHRLGKWQEEADTWYALRHSIPESDSMKRDLFFADDQAMSLYRKVKDTLGEVNILTSMGWYNMSNANFRLAESQYHSALRLMQAAGMKKVYEVYLSLSNCSEATGDLNNALYYVLKAEATYRELEVPVQSFVPLQEGLIYADLGQAEKSLNYFLGISNIYNRWWYFICRKVAEDYILLGKPGDALSYALHLEKTYPPGPLADKESLAGTKGDCYAALNNPRLAEINYLQMIRLDEAEQKFRSRDVNPFEFSLAGSEAYFKIARFYFEQNEFARARTYLSKAFSNNSFTGNNYHTANLVRKMDRLQFRVDSALGDYVSAIRYYEKFTTLTDSIFDAEKTRQFQQLQAANETQKKEHDIQLKDQTIRAMVQTDQLREAYVKRADLIRDITISATLLVLALSGILYKQYRQIRHANGTLSGLVKEKEWLLREVHHRVKNNLQTVISLLESQAAYLENDSLKALEVSRQRIYTMSLIHQKLYQTADIESIDMSVYIPELVEYLKESIDSNTIHFSLNVAPVTLGTGQAIPLALIINEALTNSIKHAFLGHRQGEIILSLFEHGGSVRLQITDNGIGMKPGQHHLPSASLGLDLMKGLAKELRGKINFENRNGVRITLLFEKDNLTSTGRSTPAIFKPSTMPNKNGYE